MAYSRTLVLLPRLVCARGRERKREGVRNRQTQRERGREMGRNKPNEEERERWIVVNIRKSKEKGENARDGKDDELPA